MCEGPRDVCLFLSVLWAWDVESDCEARFTAADPYSPAHIQGTHHGASVGVNTFSHESSVYSLRAHTDYYLYLTGN